MSSSSTESPFQQSVKMTRTMCLPPQFFTGNIMEHIASILVQQYSDKCDQEIGVMINVSRILQMTNKISKNSKFAEFTVDFEAIVAKPVVDMKFRFSIEQVQATGLFGTVEKMIKIFVPVSYLKGWTFVEDEKNAEKSVFKRASDEMTLSQGMNVPAEIKHVKFLTDKFGCIASLLM